MLKMLLGLLAVLLLSGCSHKLEVINISDYKHMEHDALQAKSKIGIVTSSNDKEGEQIIRGIASSLSNYSAEVFYPYNFNGTVTADVIAKIEVTHQYDGSGWNFLINWPGFLIWTPAWNGYIYKAKYDIDILLTDANNTKIDDYQMPIDLDIRHAEMDRTWTEIGWLEVGIIPFIGGIVFINYDDDVTPILLNAIEAPIGDYIAQDIVHHINRYYLQQEAPSE